MSKWLHALPSWDHSDLRWVLYTRILDQIAEMYYRHQMTMRLWALQKIKMTGMTVCMTFYFRLSDWEINDVPSDPGDYDYDSDFVEMNEKISPGGGGNADVDPYSGKRLNNMILFGHWLSNVCQEFFFPRIAEKRWLKSKNIQRLWLYLEPLRLLICWLKVNGWKDAQKGVNKVFCSVSIRNWVPQTVHVLKNVGLSYHEAKVISLRCM